MPMNMTLDQATGLQDVLDDYIESNLADIIDQYRHEIINHLKMDGYTVIKPEIDEED